MQRKRKESAGARFESRQAADEARVREGDERRLFLKYVVNTLSRVKKRPVLALSNVPAGNFVKDSRYSKCGK